MRYLPKGITERVASYRARVSVGANQFSKDFNFKDHATKEVALTCAIDWLEETRSLACTLATGKTSKYKTTYTGELTQDILKEFLSYDPLTGNFTWNKSEAVFIKTGDLAGCLDNKGYIIITLFNKCYKAHRLAFLYMQGFLLDTDYDIDHIDRNPANNAWENLRVATRSENQSNRHSTKSNTGIKGVHKLKYNGMYKASVELNGRQVTRLFTDAEQASKWVAEARRVLHGEFAHD